MDSKHIIQTVRSPKDERSYHINYSPIVNTDGTISQMAISRDITEQQQVREEREKLIDELQEALNNIKTLKGLVPICSVCKKIRDDKGYWNQIEEFIESHSNASFSHGTCPECLEKLYGKQDWFMKAKEKKQQKKSD